MLTQSERAQIFAMRLAQALNDAKLTVLDINISPMYLKGEILPPLNEIIRIANKLDVTAEWLSGLDCVYQKKRKRRGTDGEMQDNHKTVRRQHI